MSTKIAESAERLREELGLDKETRDLLSSIEENVVMNYTLADAIREGSKVTRQEVGGWGDGETACALTAAAVAVKARGYVS